MFRVGDRVKIVNSDNYYFNYFNGMLGTAYVKTCDTAFYILLDSGSCINFRTSSLELVVEPAQDSYMELFT